jgi:hypothetical protein
LLGATPRQSRDTSSTLTLGANAAHVGMFARELRT